MTPTQGHQDLVDALGESSGSRVVVKRWCRDFKHGNPQHNIVFENR